MPGFSMTTISLLSLLHQHATQTPDKLFIQDQDGCCDFESFYRRAAHIAASVQNAKADSQIVGIYETKPIPFFTQLVGIWMAGKQAMPLNIRMPTSNIEACLKKSGCTHVIGSGLQKPEGIDGSYQCVDSIGLTQVTNTSVLPSPDDRAIIMFTSGSTGAPKAIPLTFSQIALNAELACQLTEMNAADRLLITMPPYFTSAICHFLTCVLTGASLIATSGFSFGSQLYTFINKYGATAFGGSPVNVRRALAASKTGEELASIRFWISSGDALAADEQQAFLNTFKNVRFIYMYGLSEVGGRLCVNDTRKNPNKIGAAGLPISGMSISVVDADGSTLPAGEIGEFCVRGPLLMEGYLLDDGSIDKISTTNGFMTGDIGYVDSDGFVWHIGRKDDVLKIGGEKVSTVQVETSIRNAVQCRDCCVAIIDDQNLGKVLIGLVVPEEDNQLLDQIALYKRLKQDLPPNALPAKVYQVQAIPRTGSGKVQKSEARDLALAMVRSA